MLTNENSVKPMASSKALTLEASQGKTSFQKKPLSVEDQGIWATLREQHNLIWIILIASGGGFLFGNDIGYIGPVLTFDSFQKTMSESEPITATEEALIVGTFSIGAVLGALPFVSAFFVENLGRKWSIFIGSVIFCIGAIWQAASTNLITFYFGRMWMGSRLVFCQSSCPYTRQRCPRRIFAALWEQCTNCPSRLVFLSPIFAIGPWRTIRTGGWQ